MIARNERPRVTALSNAEHEVDPSVYNRAIADANETTELAATDLSGTRFEPESGYRKTK